jgi:hypothetical protein
VGESIQQLREDVGELEMISVMNYGRRRSRRRWLLTLRLRAKARPMLGAATSTFTCPISSGAFQQC